MKKVTTLIITLLTVVFLAESSGQHVKSNVQWSSETEYRVLVRVDPVEINGRESDEMPASYQIDFAELLATNDLSGQVDLSSLKVHKYNPTTGATEIFKPFDTAVNDYDRPCRFDDNMVPEDYPSRHVRASDCPDGRGRVMITKRTGRLFNRLMDNTAGQIVWVHTQQDNQPSYYAIYFDVHPSKNKVGPSPAPWIGDVDVLRKKEGMSLSGMSHFKLSAGDFNGDGLFDLVAGVEKGDLMWFPNQGTPGHPKFVGCRMLADEQGPIDVGWYAAPFLYDWDNDGLQDLLVGTARNVILWWKNIGTSTEPKLKYKGFVQAGGERLATPPSPVPEDAKDIFIKVGDYYNQPWVGDWDGDGLPDILTGGYTSGLVFYYHCTGRDSQGIPILEYHGTLQADGKKIDTTWAAAPTAYDFDDDGKMELITGSWWWSGIPHEPKPGQVDFLMYYDNVGTQSQANLTRTVMPKKGKFPKGSIARASVTDWNNDELPDLLVSCGHNVYLFLNEGTRQHPSWRINTKPLTIPWGIYTAYGLGNNPVDIDGDGTSEMLRVSSFSTVTGSPYYPTLTTQGIATAGGKRIEHPGSGYGDPYAFTYLRDWDKDGKADILWGTHQGNIYLHRGLKGSDPFAFAEGIKLTLKTGNDLKVGPPVADSPENVTDFTILQGSRIRFIAEDFDGDGIDDLAVTDTYGDVWIFLNTQVGGTDTLAPGVKLAKYNHFTWGFNPIDWNGDGKTDIISTGSAMAPGLLLLNKSKPGQPAFSKPFRPKGLETLPHVFWGPNFNGIDWNKDGDDDILIQSEFYSFWAERSFLEHGYCSAVFTDGIEKKK